MTEPLAGTDASAKGEPGLEEMGHPRGTLAIVAVYGVLLALGWLSMYLFAFIERGAPRS